MSRHLQFSKTTLNTSNWQGEVWDKSRIALMNPHVFPHIGEILKRCLKQECDIVTECNLACSKN